MKIALVAPTGHVGGRALEKLVAAGAEVTALCRQPGKLPPALLPKLKVAEGSLENADFVTAATAGADVLFWLTPPNARAEDLRGYTLGLGANAAQAIEANHIRRVVNLSSHGAEQPNLGPVTFVGEVEKLLDAAAPNTVHLRAGSFMENLLNSLPTLKQGRLFDAAGDSERIPLVATRDIGDIAAKWLLDSSWAGHRVAGVQGPADLTMREVSEILSRVLGRTITFHQITLEQVRENLTKAGFSASVVEAYVQMNRTFHSGHFRAAESRSPDTTTPTTLETFVREVIKPLV